MAPFESFPIGNMSTTMPPCIAEWIAYNKEAGIEQSLEDSEFADCPARFAPMTTFENEPVPAADTNIYLGTADGTATVHQWEEWIQQCREDGIIRVKMGWQTAPNTGTGQFVNIDEDANKFYRACALRKAYWGDVNDDGLKDLIIITRGDDCSFDASTNTFVETGAGCTNIFYIFNTGEGASGDYSYVDNQGAGYEQCVFDEICPATGAAAEKSADGYSISISVTIGQSVEGAEVGDGPIPGQETSGCGVATGSAFGRPMRSPLDRLIDGIAGWFE